MLAFMKGQQCYLIKRGRALVLGTAGAGQTLHRVQQDHMLMRSAKLPVAELRDPKNGIELATVSWYWTLN